MGMIRFLLQPKLPEMQEKDGFRELLMPLGNLYGSLRFSFVFHLLVSVLVCVINTVGNIIWWCLCRMPRQRMWNMS